LLKELDIGLDNHPHKTLSDSAQTTKFVNKKIGHCMPSHDIDMHNNWLRQEVKEERIAVEHPIPEVSQSGRSGGTADRQFLPQKDLNWGGVLDNRVPASQ
jgi:hypothetical protein